MIEVIKDFYNNPKCEFQKKNIYHAGSSSEVCFKEFSSNERKTLKKMSLVLVEIVAGFGIVSLGKAILNCFEESGFSHDSVSEGTGLIGLGFATFCVVMGIEITKIVWSHLKK